MLCAHTHTHHSVHLPSSDTGLIYRQKKIINILDCEQPQILLLLKTFLYNSYKFQNDIIPTHIQRHNKLLKN